MLVRTVRLRFGMQLPFFLELISDDSDEESAFETKSTAIGRAATIPFDWIGKSSTVARYCGSS